MKKPYKILSGGMALMAIGIIAYGTLTSNKLGFFKNKNYENKKISSLVYNLKNKDFGGDSEKIRYYLERYYDKNKEYPFNLEELSGFAANEELESYKKYKIQRKVEKEGKEVYEEVKSEYPYSLDELSKFIIENRFNDPFNTKYTFAYDPNTANPVRIEKQPFHYERISPEECYIWSIGPDSINNNHLKEHNPKDGLKSNGDIILHLKEKKEIIEYISY